VVTRFKAICFHVLCVSEENHEGLQDSMSSSRDWKQQGHSLVAGQFDCRFYFFVPQAENFRTQC
jgi:hypothetical protein